MNIDNERAKFEAWVASEIAKGYACDTLGDEAGNPLWNGWLARAQSDKSVSVGALEGLADGWERKERSCTESSYDMGWGDAKDWCCDELRALIAKETGDG